ncbi:MAG: hypothetical protein JWP91_391 [Fibrobacteres bacterium]|nr:hypothetical protein [Fibrobacterota bacterium]
MKRAIYILAGLSLAVSAAQAFPGKSLYAASAKPAAQGESMNAAPLADLPPSPPTPAMEDKFRKLQKEMERKDPGGKSGATAETAKSPENSPSGGVSVGTLGLQILFGLAFVLLLAVVSIRGLKRIQGRLLSKPGRGGGDIFEVLETCHLGPHQRVVAMRLNDEVGILGVTQQGISLLTMLKEPVEELRRARAGESNSAAFSDNLNKLLERFKKPKKVSDLLDEGQA